MNKLIRNYNYKDGSRAELQEVNKDEHIWYRIVLTGPVFSQICFEYDLPSVIDHIVSKKDALTYFKDIVSPFPFLDRIHSALASKEVVGSTPNMNWYHPWKDSEKPSLGAVSRDSRKKYWSGKSGNAYFDIESLKKERGLPENFSEDFLSNTTLLHELGHMDYNLSNPDRVGGSQLGEIVASRYSFDKYPGSREESIYAGAYGLFGSAGLPKEESIDLIKSWDALKQSESREREGLEVDPYG